MKIKKSFAIEMSEEEYKYFGDALRHLEEMLGEVPLDQRDPTHQSTWEQVGKILHRMRG